MGPADGRHHRRARRRHADDRQHLRSGPSAGRDGKKGGADRCLGRSRGGLTTKIHVVVDAQGLPIRLGLTAGLAHDGQIADTLFDHLGPRTIVLADKAYDADRIRELLRDQGATPNIPPKSNRKWKPCFSKRLYRERNLIERFFSKLKHFRRVATRYDKLAANFLAMIQLASIRLWLRAYESTAYLADTPWSPDRSTSSTACAKPESRPGRISMTRSGERAGIPDSGHTK